MATILSSIADGNKEEDELGEGNRDCCWFNLPAALLMSMSEGKREDCNELDDEGSGLVAGVKACCSASLPAIFMSMAAGNRGDDDEVDLP